MCKDFIKILYSGELNDAIHWLCELILYALSLSFCFQPFSLPFSPTTWLKAFFLGFPIRCYWIQWSCLLCFWWVNFYFIAIFSYSTCFRVWVSSTLIFETLPPLGDSLPLWCWYFSNALAITSLSWGFYFSFLLFNVGYYLHFSSVCSFLIFNIAPF